MPTLRVNKIASVAYRLNLSRKLEITEDLEPASGNVVVVKVLSEKRVYNELELENGRLSRLSLGNIIVGALGRRRALQGFVGEVPESIKVGDTLHLLNMGGVIGFSHHVHKDLGHAAAVEVLGMAVKDGRIVNLRDAVIPAVESLKGLAVPPVVMVSGSCMNSGKTFAGSQIIQELSKNGLAVHGAKLSGVACRRDQITMEDHGALRTASFLEAGIPSTAGLDPETMVRVARTVLGNLLDGGPEVIIIELGDGIIGDYGVMPILEDPEIGERVKVHLFCAGDLVSVWGGHRFLADRKISISLVSGPATDSPVGVEYIQRTFGLPAVNARLHPKVLGAEVLKQLHEATGGALPADRRERGVERVEVGAARNRNEGKNRENKDSQDSQEIEGKGK
ncbi:MAG: hypothetical protein HY717_05790 [Planctomycetes bacterium]|nr:hypothetical protein [Planctomycetota bacterium]